MSISHLTQLSFFCMGLIISAASQARPNFDAEAHLGRLLFNDKNLSLLRNQSCASCHSLRPVADPNLGEPLASPGFVDPRNVLLGSAVSEGSLPQQQGRLNAPSIGYAAFSPFFHWNADEGLYIGGQFWNGRANNLAAQAAEPFLQAHEMAMPSAWAVVSRLKENRRYRHGFMQLYKIDLDSIPAYEAAPSQLPPPAGVYSAYTRMTEALAAFQQSRFFNRFTSKFDFYLAGMTELSEQETQGLAIFNDPERGNCAACHPSAPALAPDGSLLPPLFTDFSYDNIGVPRNMTIPGNPEPDLGLGGRSDIAARDPAGQQIGKHKVMSLRNIAITPPYAHNGVFPDLLSIVHFYNTRDHLGWVPDNLDPGFGKLGWPKPEISANLNTEELGNLGLSAEQEAALVAFLKTLTDGYPDWGQDAKVPPGTASPFAATPFPPMP